MREILEFEFTLRYANQPDNLRQFTDAEMSRIEEILGVERVEYKDERVPSWSGFTRIYATLDAEAESTRLLLQELEGPMDRIVTYNYPGRASNAISAKRRREFTPEEIDACPFFHVWPDKELAGIDCDVRWSTGEYAIEKRSIKKQLIGLVSHLQLIGCLGSVREAFEAEDFEGLRFEEFQLTGRSRKAYPPIWRMRGRPDLPWTKNQFMGDKRVPLDAYAEEGSCMIMDGCFPFRLIYAESDVTKMEGLDVGETRENLGWFSPDNGAPSDWYRRPEMVVSQKFKRYCEAKKLKLNFHPIEVV